MLSSVSVQWKQKVKTVSCLRHALVPQLNVARKGINESVGVQGHVAIIYCEELTCCDVATFDEADVQFYTNIATWHTV